MASVTSRIWLAGALVCLVAGMAAAQTSTATSTQTKDFEVMAVYGNTVAVHLPEGMREITVPDSFRFTVNGQPMSVHELQPGMKGTATITTTTKSTPVTVTEVKNGQVVMTGGGSIWVRSEGQVKAFSEADIKKRGIKLTRDGQPANIADFRQGDNLSAVIVTSGPPRVVTEQQVQATLARQTPGSTTAAAAPAPRTAAPAPASAAPAASAAAASRPQPTSTVARALPHTASATPLIGLVGVLSLSLAAMLSLRRRRTAR